MPKSPSLSTAIRPSLSPLHQKLPASKQSDTREPQTQSQSQQTPASFRSNHKPAKCDEQESNAVSAQPRVSTVKSSSQASLSQTAYGAFFAQKVDGSPSGSDFK